MNQNVEFVSDEQRIRPEKSEVERLWAENKKAKLLADWAPTYGGEDGFKRGLLETISWFSNAKNLSQYKAHIYNI